MAGQYLTEDMMLEPLQGADLIRYASKVAGYLGSAYSGEPRDIIKALIRENASLRESLHLIASTSNDAGAREEARCALGVQAVGLPHGQRIAPCREAPAWSADDAEWVTYWRDRAERAEQALGVNGTQEPNENNHG